MARIRTIELTAPPDHTGEAWTTSAVVLSPLLQAQMSDLGPNRIRPNGIIVLAVAEFLLGVFALIGGIVHLTLGIGGLTDFGGKDLTLTSNTASALQNAFTIEGVLLLVSGYGVLSMRNWGFKLTVAIALLGLATSLAALALQSSFSIIGIIANITILVYTSRPPVRAHFTSTTATSA